MLRQSLVLLALIALQPAAADVKAGKALYMPCVSCHGPGGESNPALETPGIGNQSQSYLMRQLWDFRNGRRAASGSESGDRDACRADTMLQDGNEIAAVAAYIAALPAKKPEATVEGDADNGEELYASKCGACHGGHGWGNEALYTPRLTVIGDSYLVRQVRNFQDGLRGAHPDARQGQQMALMAKDVSAGELEDIAAFLNRQPAAQ